MVAFSSLLMLPAVAASGKATVYHLMQFNHTGLANKDAGDFMGDVDFILTAIGGIRPGNPEAHVYGNVIEMSEVQVTGWTNYTDCNLCDGTETEPCVDGYWCEGGSNFTAATPPGKMHNGPHALWYSFPAVSEGRTWMQSLKRRISSECLVKAWREAAGGCKKCGDKLESHCLMECLMGLGTDALKASWDQVFSSTAVCPDLPLPAENKTVYHIMQPNHTGLANKDAGDFLGDVDFIMDAIAGQMKDNVEAKIYGNVIEMLEVEAVMGWTDYQPCNACDGTETEPCVDGYWCVGSSNFTTATLPGKQHYGDVAMWYSFPAASEGHTWKQTLKRRISSECLVKVWREAAGGCDQCDDKLVSKCLQKCIRALNDTALKASWDTAFRKTPPHCPDLPAPGAVVVV